MPGRPYKGIWKGRVHRGWRALTAYRRAYLSKAKNRGKVARVFEAARSGKP
jgi:hypothetical protein